VTTITTPTKKQLKTDADYFRIKVLLEVALEERNALAARAEAAEALAYERLEAALFAEQRATDAEAERDSANIEAALEQANAREAWERVAELEAAQGWRPVTEEWPPCDLKVVISAPGASWAEVASKHYDGDEYVWELENGHAFDFESATVALPLPQEPTP